jgi:hypothetical protein
VNELTECEPSRGERLMIAAAGLDWARALVRRSRDQLQQSDSVRAHPIIADLVATHERLAGIERLLWIIREVERQQ